VKTFNASQNASSDGTIATRESLLSRLKNSGDHESWKTFFDTYSRLLYNTAVKAGLTPVEAQDAVQETVISVMKTMPKFEYDPAKGSFKSWLMQLTSWRINDQFRKRRHEANRVHRCDSSPTATDTIGGLADPATQQLEAIWEEEWESNLWEAAVQRVKNLVHPKQYQIFDLYVIQENSVWQVSRALKINPGQVYLAKHRVGSLIKKEIERLRQKPI
jgi:RNA polymerase sigma factor (sigma-70 family)